ncbi:MAG: FAD-binding protein [Ktedonobacteraceae bacterium]|nr:FAD-binding protein [Ktedonobacteraceae bacterium]
MATGIVSSAKKQSWSNWSGSVRCQPRELAKPASIDELATLIRRGNKEGRHIRVAGAGHSFTPLVQTDDILISLDNIRGIERVDREQMRATVLGGTRLKEVGESLFAHGLAQENLGDINVQSIAGAISTGTHGTGINYGSLATQVVGLTLVTASGEILECSAEQNADIFKAAQVSLGVLGVIVKVVLRVVPAKRLHFLSRRERLSDVLDDLEKLKQENSHFEFFWMPHTEWVQAKYLNETDEPANESSTWNTFNRVVLENGVYWLLSEGCRLVPRLARTVSTVSAYGIATVNDVDYSHRLFSTPRKVRFQEMEYSIPAEHTRIVLAEIKNYIERYKFAVHFPVECRFVHSDDIWLSPAYEREAAYIAVHMYRGMAYQDYFRRVEEIFKRYEGRPHWGKMHTRTAQELATLYPHWHDFRRIRAELDPAGVFLNDYLRRLFEVEPA